MSFDVSCLIELGDDDPNEAASIYLDVMRDFLAGHVEWMCIDVVDRDTGQHTTVMAKPRPSAGALT